MGIRGEPGGEGAARLFEDVWVGRGPGCDFQCPPREEGSLGGTLPTGPAVLWCTPKRPSHSCKKQKKKLN